MTTIILVILGVLLAAAAVLFVIYYGGDAFGNGHIEAEAGRLVGEGAQMEAALELYYRQEGHYPTSDDPVAELIAAGYLDYQPLGTRTTEADRWAINYDAGMILARLGTTGHEESTSICLKARQQLDLPAANTSTGIYRCDGSDSPGGRLAGREPCCIGEVGVGGGPAERDVFATATLCNNLASMPVNTDAQKAAYIVAAGACVEQRTTLTNQRFTSLADIGDPPLDYTAMGGGNPLVEEYDNGNIFFRYDVDNQEKCDAIGYRPNGSFSWSQTDQCYWGYRVPRRYYRNITATYRPAQAAFLKSEADKIAASIGQRGYLGADMQEFVSAYGGYEPDMKGQTSSAWTLVDESSGRFQIRANVPHGGFCNWFRANRGYASNQYEYHPQMPEYCWYSSSAGWRYQANVTDQVRNAQLDKLRAEAEKIKASLLSGSYAGYDMAAFQAQGGYTPNMNGFPGDGWTFMNWNNGGINLRITHTSTGLCEWFRNNFDGDGNEFNTYSRKPEYCAEIYRGPAYYDFNISVDYRAKQKAILNRERLKLRADYLDKNGDTSAMTYQPDFDGVIPNNGTFYERSGKTYYRSRVDIGLCYYLYDEVNATQNNHTNMLNFHYRKNMCLDFYRDGTYALLDLTVD